MKCIPITVLFTIICFMANPARTKTIAWDEASLVLVREHAGYGRMIRLSSGNILAAYSLGTKVWALVSTDDGTSWKREVLVGECPWGISTNSELLQLNNGKILYFWNNRPQKNSGKPFTIMMASSADDGATWSAPCQVFSGGADWGTGCWEPAAIQLSSGELQLFFANETPYPDTGEQEISLMRSNDRGKTWNAPETVTFRSGHRDGMPVPLVLQDGKGIVLAIEDDGIHGAFKPVITKTSVRNSWQNGPVEGDSSNRWSALKNALPAEVYAGAPYIRQMPDGTTILSCQSREGGRTKARMVVYVGNGSARYFDNPTIPFKNDPHAAGEWNALFVKDHQTITAISGTTINGISGLWAMDGCVK